MKIALVQMEVLEKNKAGNVQKACELLRQAAPNCDVAVLPEIWTTGYSLGHLSKEADYLNGTVVNELRQIAAENSCAIVAGSIPLRKGDGNVYNTAITIDKNGEIVFCYSKVHLFSMFNEQRFFKPGNDFGVYELEGATCASAICYDLRFPVWSRNCGDYDLALYVASWPVNRIVVWDLLLKARAVENQCYVVGANRVGADPVCDYTGNSAIIHPYGKAMAELRDGESGCVSAVLDMEWLSGFRDKFPSLRDADKYHIEV